MLAAYRFPIDVSSLLLFGLLVFATENLGIDLPVPGGVSISFAIFYAVGITFGPLMAALCGFFGSVLVKDFTQRTSPFRWLFNGAQLSMSAASAAMAYSLFGGRFLSGTNGVHVGDFPLLLVPLAFAAGTYFVLNTWFVSLAIALFRGQSSISIWSVDMKWLIPNYFALAPLGLALGEVYVKSGAPGILLLVIPLLVARETFRVSMEMRETYMGTVRSLVAAIEAKDPYTRGHSERVAEFSERIARHLHLSEEQIEQLKCAALLHDIGKIGISKKILTKPSTLTAEEYAKIKEHPMVGYNILQGIEQLNYVLPAIYHHHERIDGGGYVGGLVGDKIPLMARILCVADAFDAMTSERSYRSAMDIHEAANEFVRKSGTQFDPDVVLALFESLGLQQYTVQLETAKGVPVPVG